jgi:hypothetical protein
MSCDDNFKKSIAIFSASYFLNNGTTFRAGIFSKEALDIQSHLFFSLLIFTFSSNYMYVMFTYVFLFAMGSL